MKEKSIFDTLVTELSAEERRELLDRIRKTAPISADPFYSPTDFARTEMPDYEARVASLGLFKRIFLFFKRLFTGKSLEELLREEDIKEIHRRFSTRSTGMIDLHRGLLLDGLAEELRRLRDAARYFYDLLDRSVEKDKGTFFAFLGSIELSDLHQRLIEETDPFRNHAETRSVQESEVRAELFSALEIAFDSLTDGGRRAMYANVRSLLFLKRLSGFLFERLIGSFREGFGSEGLKAAPFSDVRELLLDLGDILYSMAEPPSIPLMEAIFVFVEREEFGRSGANVEKLLAEDLTRAETSLGRIRAFNARVPMADLLRIVSGDPAYSPRELPGGEDWLALYKSFWRERTERLLTEWKNDRRYKELAEEIAVFVGQPGAAGFTNISREGRESSPPIRFEIALSFLDAFYRGPLLREMSRPLKLVMLDGEFYRKDNRLEYTDSYDILLRIPESLAALDARLGPGGDLGSAWLQAKAEVVASSIAKRKLQGIARSAEDEAERLLRRVYESLRTMTLILGGVLKGEAGGRYDSLANLSYLDGKANKEFLRSLGQIKDRCEKACSILQELSGIDLAGGT